MQLGFVHSVYEKPADRNPHQLWTHLRYLVRWALGSGKQLRKKIARLPRNGHGNTMRFIASSTNCNPAV